MRTALTYLALVVAPAVLVLLGRWALLRLGSGPTRWSRRALPAAGRPLERLTADLRRLEQEYRATERSDQPGKGARLHALGMAYDDVLRECCRALGLPEPRPAPLDAVSRMETELALVQRGVTW